MKEESDFRIVEPAPAGEIVANKTDPNTGAVLCPECGNGSVWKDEKTGKMVTSPMRRMDIPGKVNALVHACCGRAVIQKAFARPAPAGSVPPPRGPVVSVEANVNNDQK